MRRVRGVRSRVCSIPRPPRLTSGAPQCRIATRVVVNPTEIEDGKDRKVSSKEMATQIVEAHVEDVTVSMHPDPDIVSEWTSHSSRVGPMGAAVVRQGQRPHGRCGARGDVPHFRARVRARVVSQRRVRPARKAEGVPGMTALAPVLPFSRRPTRLQREMASPRRVNLGRFGPLSGLDEDLHPSRILAERSKPHHRVGELYEDILTDTKVAGLVRKRLNGFLCLPRRIDPGDASKEAAEDCGPVPSRRA